MSAWLRHGLILKDIFIQTFLIYMKLRARVPGTVSGGQDMLLLRLLGILGVFGLYMVVEYNEKLTLRAVQMIEGLKPRIVELEATQKGPQHEGKPLVIHGKLRAQPAFVMDPVTRYRFAEPAIYYSREVYMFQYPTENKKDEVSEDTYDKLNRERERRNREKNRLLGPILGRWYPYRVQNTNPPNPAFPSVPMRFPTREERQKGIEEQRTDFDYYPQRLVFGKYILRQPVAKYIINSFKKVRHEVTKEDPRGLKAELFQRLETSPPRIGQIRILYYTLPQNKEVTILATQKKGTLVPYHIENAENEKKALEKLENSETPADTAKAIYKLMFEAEGPVFVVQSGHKTIDEMLAAARRNRKAGGAIGYIFIIPALFLSMFFILIKSKLLNIIHKNFQKRSSIAFFFAWSSLTLCVFGWMLAIVKYRLHEDGAMKFATGSGILLIVMIILLNMTKGKVSTAT